MKLNSMEMMVLLNFIDHALTGDEMDGDADARFALIIWERGSPKPRWFGSNDDCKDCVQDVLSNAAKTMDEVNSELAFTRAEGHA